MARGLVFVVALIAVAVGVWAGVTTAGTSATPWIHAALGAAMMVFGAAMILARDPFDRRNRQLTGAGSMLMGASYFIPFGVWRIAIALVALGVMFAPVVRRRRAGRRPSA